MKMILTILTTFVIMFVTFWKIWSKKFEEMAKKTKSEADDILINIINGIVPFLNALVDKEGKELTKNEKMEITKTILKESKLMEKEEKEKINETLEKKF